MRKDSILRALKQSFHGAVPESDGRVNLSHLDFITGLVFCFLGDTKSFGLEAIRRFLIATFEKPISKGAFWERLSRNRLKGILHDLMERLMNRFFLYLPKALRPCNPGCRRRRGSGKSLCISLWSARFICSIRARSRYGMARASPIPGRARMRPSSGTLVLSCCRVE